MFPLGLARNGPLQVLAIGAHSDDVEIGCGATILALTRAYELHVTWVVLGAADARADEARASAEAFLGAASSRSIECHDFRDGFFPYVGGAVKEVFEALKGVVSPDVIFTHARHDRHQDHRLVSELTWNTWRDHLVLEYEIPKYDGDLLPPNAYVHVPAEEALLKVDLLTRHFPSQHDKHWFDEELFRGLMRLRGAESRAPSGYAEAFFAHKLALALAP